MNKYTRFCLVALIGLFTQCQSSQDDAGKQKAQAILKKMTLEEKAGQMTQLSIEMISAGEGFNLEKPHRIDTAKLRKVIVDLHVGSILNVGGHTYTPAHWKEIMDAIHATEALSRLKIPVLYGIDAIHGANYTEGSTLFPQQISLAASFNPALIQQMANMAANDVRASGIPWNFSPVLDVGRNPMWPRFWETFGEDPYLVSQLGVAMVKGYQSKTPNGMPGVAACLKHYVGYSDPKNGLDRTPAYIPERQLREIFLYPFAAAIHAGAKTIMVNSAEVNGEPVHASKFLLKTILRDELKFEGITVSDWEDVKNLCDRHHVAATYKEAVALAVNAGIDMAMVPLDFDFTQYLIENVREGNIKEARIDEAVLRILKLKIDLGLFEEDNSAKYEGVGSDASKKLSAELAAQSIVLLKNNEQILPLAQDEKILITGPNADYINALNGGWTHTWQGRDTSWNPAVKTIKEGMMEVFGSNRVKYLAGNTYETHLSPQQLLEAANGINHVVLCLGEDTYTEKPGDINDLELSKAQQELIAIYKQAGKKVIVLLLEGRPRTFAQTESLCDAVLWAGLPGNESAVSIAEIMIGKRNPEGKLPFTFPRYSSSHSTYDRKYTECLNNDFKYSTESDLYPFGWGLSYTQFTYSDLKISNRNLRMSDSIELSFTLRNTGNRAGSETVMIYSSDVAASITPSVKRLRAFRKISLNAGEENKVNMKIACESLSFVGLNNKWVLEPGTFEMRVSELKDSIIVMP